MLVGVHAQGGDFLAVGSAGSVVRHDGGGGCGLEARDGAPPGFLSGVYALGATTGYAVGDAGLLLSIDPNQSPAVQSFGTGYQENLQAIWVNNNTNGDQRLWMVGADGTLIVGAFY